MLNSASALATRQALQTSVCCMTAVTRCRRVGGAPAPSRWTPPLRRHAAVLRAPAGCQAPLPLPHPAHPAAAHQSPLHWPQLPGSALPARAAVAWTSSARARRALHAQHGTSAWRCSCPGSPGGAGHLCIGTTWPTPQSNAEHSTAACSLKFQARKGPCLPRKAASGRAKLQRQLQYWKAKVLSAELREDWIHTSTAQGPQVDSLYAKHVPIQAG